ncbi:hypothetical protein ABBQ32_006312 [Trebouxia sp. C0010 RCD-2024]
MVATVLAATSSPALVSRQVVGRKAINGVSVVPVQRRTVCRVSRTTMASSSQQRQYQLPVAVTTGVAAALANPLVAEAGVTPSLKNLLYSVVAGGTIAVLIATAVTGVSNFDPTKRGNK